MTAPKRVVLAFSSLLVGFMLFAIVGIVPTAILYGPRYALPAVQIMPLYLLFALPGLVLALPFVLFFKSAKGYRAWIMLAIGSIIGPAFLGVWAFLASHGHFSWQANGAALIMSIWIGLPTTVLYVLLLRRFDRRSLSSSKA